MTQTVRGLLPVWTQWYFNYKTIISHLICSSDQWNSSSCVFTDLRSDPKQQTVKLNIKLFQGHFCCFISIKTGWDAFKDVSSEQFSFFSLKWGIQTVFSVLEGNWSVNWAGEGLAGRRRVGASASRVMSLISQIFISRVNYRHTRQDNSMKQIQDQLIWKWCSYFCLHELFYSETATAAVTSASARLIKCFFSEPSHFYQTAWRKINRFYFTDKLNLWTPTGS